MAETLSREDHMKRHVELHRAFDELLADFLVHNRKKAPSTTTVLELAQWSNRQTRDPDEDSSL